MKSKYTKVRKETQDLERKAKRIMLENQCDCNHTDKETGRGTLEVVNNKDNSKEMAFKCSQCHKIVMSTDKSGNFNLPDDNKFNSLMSDIDEVLDVIKICMNSNTEKGKDGLEKIKTCQKILKLTVTRIFPKIREDSENKSKRYRNNNTTRKSGSRMYI